MTHERGERRLGEVSLDELAQAAAFYRSGTGTWDILAAAAIEAVIARRVAVAPIGRVPFPRQL